MIARARRWLDWSSAWLDSLSPSRFVAMCYFATMVISVGFFSPKFWLLRQPLPGTFEWSRALTVLKQAEAPLDLSSVPEAAMRWRILPALAAHVLQLGASAVWILPQLGLAALLACTSIIVARATSDRACALLTTALAGTAGGIITINIFFGFGDAWFLLGLLAAAFSRSTANLVCAGLLCPWVDERFVIGLPLALFCRGHIFPDSTLRRDIVALAPGVLAYAAVRAVAGWLGHNDSSADYLLAMLVLVPVGLPYVPLGWWMGFRAAWLLVLVPLVLLPTRHRSRPFLLGMACAVATLLAMTLLATDTTRSTSLLLPLLISAPILLTKVYSRHTVRLVLAGVLLANLVIPFVWVTYNKTWLVLPLPVEIVRTWKN